MLLDFSLIDCAKLSTPYNLDMVEFFRIGRLALDYQKNKGNQHNKQLEMLSQYYSHFVSHNGSTTLRYDVTETSVMNPPVRLERMRLHGQYDDDGVLNFYAAVPNSQVTDKDWDEFALIVLQKIAAHYVNRFTVSGRQGGRPMMQATVDAFARCLAQRDGNTLSVFTRPFWNGVINDIKWYQSSVSFVDLVVSVTDTQTKFKYWRDKDVAIFVKSVRRCSVSDHPDKFVAALQRVIATQLPGVELAWPLMPAGKATKLLEKSRFIWKF
jgi:hypothetical protein